MKSNADRPLIRATFAPPSYTVLAETPTRAVQFLIAVAVVPEILAALSGAGYTKEDHNEGWSLLLDVGKYRGEEYSVADAPDNPAANALAAIEASIGPMFKRMQAALRHKHPRQEAFVFGGLRIGRGVKAMLTLATLLNRCDALQDGEFRKETRKEDRAALATLRERGLGAVERNRMRALIDVAHTTTDVPARTKSELDPPNERAMKIVALHAWVQDWCETARAVIKNRAWLIRLGAAKRRARRNAASRVVASTAEAPTHAVEARATNA